VIKKPARWEIIVMTVAAGATLSGLFYLKYQSDWQRLRHLEVMADIAALKAGIAEAAPLANQLFASANAENRAVFELLSPDSAIRQRALKYLDQHWQPSASAKVIEALAVSGGNQNQAERIPVIELLSRKTGQQFGNDINAWQQFLLSPEEKESWRSEPACQSYLDFKAQLYHRVDPRFVFFFAGHPYTAVDPREIRWLGSPLSNTVLKAKFVEAAQANFMQPNDLVFGMEAIKNSSHNSDLNSYSVAYPQRILRWHNVVENASNQLIFYDQNDQQNPRGQGNKRKTCTFAFNRKIGDSILNFSESGFAYRGEKLLYDQQSKSLWLPRTGQMVLGAAERLPRQITALPVVQCSWRLWLVRHPRTRVLSLETGFKRDYNSAALVHD